MSTENLREVIKQKEKAKSGYDGKEPRPWLIGHKLATFQWFIFEADEAEYPSVVADTLKLFGYEKLDELRADATGVMIELRKELSPEDWEGFFSSRRENPPYLDVPKPEIN